MTATAATGFAAGDQALPELAATAVKDALANAGSDYAHSVILFLTSQFARHAQQAVSAAGRAANCLQIAGGTCPGVFTEMAWALHQPAAAALVLCGPVSLGPVQASEPAFTLVQPEKLSTDWLIPYPPRFGMLATGPEEGPEGVVWGQGKVRREGRFDASFHGARTRTAVSRGLQILSPTLHVSDRDGFDLFYLSGSPALNTLLLELPAEMGNAESLPVQRLCALVLEPGIPSSLALAEGRYTVIPVMGINPRERSVSLAAPLPEESPLIWAWRTPEAAEKDTTAALDQFAAEGGPAPDFALMMACMGRGPYFFQGHDRDLALLSARYPELPVIGAYGAGEIAPFAEGNGLLSYSTVLTLVNTRV